MKNLEDKIREQGFPQEELPLGHRDRFESLLNTNFGVANQPQQSKQIGNGSKFGSKLTRRLIIAISSVAAVFAILFTILTPSDEELMDRELAAMRQEIIENNVKEVEKLHNSILDLAKQKLEAEDYAELQQSISELHSNYMSIIEKSDSIPTNNFETMMQKALNLNIATYRRINIQLAKN